jgi:2-dehydropantoate 2-reductase
MNILIIGTGAIGSFYGSLLAKAGASVSVVARSDYDYVRAHGIAIRSEKLGAWHFKPEAVYRHLGDLKTQPDYILLCVKMVAGVDQAALVRDALGPATSIVLIANGIDVEHELAAAFPSHELISALAFVCVTRTAPGKIWHQDYGRLVLGTYPQGRSAKVQALADAFVCSGIAAEASDDIVTARWSKCVWNAPFNPLSVLSGGLTVKEILGVGESFVRDVMNEICRIAAALGHALPPDTVDKMISYSFKMEPYKTSMLIDFEAGRPLETEAILGAALRAGRKVNVVIPHLESLYTLMKMREAHISQNKETL